jgi:phosphoglycerate dehydrogenase-like enzyme
VNRLDRHAPSSDHVGVADELPKLIGQADIVVNVTPLTPETTGLEGPSFVAI